MFLIPRGRETTHSPWRRKARWDRVSTPSSCSLPRENPLGDPRQQNPNGRALQKGRTRGIQGGGQNRRRKDSCSLAAVFCGGSIHLGESPHGVSRLQDQLPHTGLPSVPLCCTPVPAPTCAAPPTGPVLAGVCDPDLAGQGALPADAMIRGLPLQHQVALLKVTQGHLLDGDPASLTSWQERKRPAFFPLQGACAG